MVEIFSAENINVLKQMPLTQYATAMKEVAVDLKKNGIDYFAYSVMHRDGTREVLSAVPEFAELFIREKLYRKMFCGNVDHFNNGYYLLSQLNCPDFSALLRESCHIIDGMIVTKCFPNNVDIFYFGHKSGQLSSEFYLNDILFFEKFISHFYEKMYKVLISSRNRRLIYSDGCGDTSNLTKPNLHNEEIKLIDTVDVIPKLFLQRLKEIGLKYEFTQKEFLVMKYLCNGLRAKEIARQMHSSPRTIEKHLVSIKEKTASRGLLHLLSQFFQGYL